MGSKATSFFSKICSLMLYIFWVLNSCKTQIQPNQTENSPKPPDPTILTSIDSYGSENTLPGRRYILLPYDSSDADNYLQYELFEKYVTKELALRKYKRVTWYDSADCIIFFKYGISDQKAFQRDVYLPVFGLTGNSVSFSGGSANLKYYPWGKEYYNQRSTVTFAEYGQAGAIPYKTTEYYFSHFLILSAFEKPTNNHDFKKCLKWKIIASLNTKESDLRKMFPYLVIAAGPYIGKDSKQEVKSTVYLEDRKYYWLVNDLPDSALAAHSLNPKNELLNKEELKLRSISQYQNLSSFQKLNSMEELKIGDLVMLKGEYDNLIYGIVDEILSPSEIKIITYPAKGNRLIVECRLGELYRLKDLPVK
jgi:hypothetical protein